ncbi:MAG TPA: hypothetical protein DCP38_05535 [Acidobacteria bacterium]|nr:hypothetical protein [Acidobacteriota bacterium]
MSVLRSVVRASSVVGLALLVSFASPGAVEAQFGAGPSPVRYTEAQAHTMRRSVQLPGTVESASMSIVASEMAGLVTELPAREGMAVSQGDILASLRSTNLELRMQATESELREAEARAQLAERELERARDLFADELFSQQQLDGAEFEFNARIGKQAQLEADLAVLQDDLERSVIRAPFDGVVVDEQTEVGQWLTVGGPVVELHALSRLEVVVEVPERYFGAIERGTVATVQVGSLDGLEVEGRVNAIIPRASTQARTFPVKVRIDNSKSRIGVGMLTQVAFPIGESYDAVVVPKDALVLRGPQRFVYVIGDDDAAAILPVEVGSGAGQWIAIEGPVPAGSRVITRGNERLQPGQAVAGEALDYPLP